MTGSVNAALSHALEQRIQGEIQSHDVVLFMKGNAQFPMCGFSGTVVQILNRLGITFKTVDILKDGELREGIKLYSDWPTLPQLYIKGEFVGGCDIVREMFETGELQSFLKDKGIDVSATAAS